MLGGMVLLHAAMLFSLSLLTAIQEGDDGRTRFHRAPKALAADAVAEDSPGFLGARRTPRSAERPLAKRFEQDELALVWERASGSGYAAPAILGERLVHTFRRDDQEIVECLRREDGKLLWSHAIPTAYEDPFGFGDGPKCTPLLEGELAWTFGVEGVLRCFELATGKLRWKRELATEFALDEAFFGVGSTPLIEGDLLLVNLGQPKGLSVAAFAKESGELRWGVEHAWGASYAAPIAASVHGKRKLFVFAGGKSRPPDGGVLGIDLATRKLDFAFPWRSGTYYSANCATPIVAGDLLLATEAYGPGAVQLRLHEDGSAAPTWTSREFGLHWATPLLRGELLLGCAQEKLYDSELVCLRWRTGEVLWRQRIEWEEPPERTGGTRTLPCTIGRATLIEADGDILCLGEWGHVLWLRCDEKGATVLARAWPFFSRETWAAPVISRGLLYLAQGTVDLLTGAAPRLLCFDLRPPTAQ
jgi:outer membrane protein assembly factor BamB